MSVPAAILRRSRIGQSLAYGGLLGVLCVVPSIAVRIAGEFPRA